MCSTELPTIRDCLRYGLFLRETSPEYSSNQSTMGMLEKVLEQIKVRWKRANFKFQPPLTAQDKSILDRLSSLWEKCSKIARDRASVKDKIKFEEGLDKLFDITKCKCPFVSCDNELVTCTGCHCDDPECQGCPKNATDLPPCHILCRCPPDQKLPILELPFIKAQREKVGEKSSVMIVTPDQKESKKQTAEIEKKNEKQKKKEAKDKKDEAKKKKEEEIRKQKELKEKEDQDRVAEFLAEVPDCALDDQDNEPNENIGDFMDSNRNMTKIKNIAMASIRYGVSANATAAIANAALLDYGVIDKENTAQVIDASKVQRSKDSLHKELQEKAAIGYKEGDIKCVLFDGKKDWTLVYQEVEGSSQAYPSVVKEEHYSVVAEPGGKYLFHFTPDDDDKECSAAEQIANILVEWMTEYGVDKTIQFIGGDSTNVNSGIWGGVFQFVEKKLGRPLNWIVCGLHLNELPLRHLIIELDGPTSSDTGFTGPLGKALSSVTELPVNKNFKTITVGSDLIELNDDILKDLSTDQKYAYEIVQAIRTGNLSARLFNLEIGPVCHSRWNTMANRFCRMWVSKHGFKGKAAKNLKLIVEYIVGVYYPTWFNYKVRNSWLQGPQICLEQLHLILKQDKQVQKIVLPRLESTAWWASPEMVLQSLLCSNSVDDRLFAVRKILELRGESDQDSTASTEQVVRTRFKVKLNQEATCLKNLIMWDEEEITEPVLTMLLSEEEIKSFEVAPMSVPSMPVHGQSVERCVKEVSAASESVYGYQRRDGFIRARLAHRELTGGLIRSKKDHARIVSCGY